MRATKILLGPLLVGLTAPAAAQYDRDLHRTVGAAILSDVARDRAAERDAKRQPYVSPGLGSIVSARQARDACALKAREAAGARAELVGQPSASSMSTGWEVEGAVRAAGDEAATPFVCSVRNGSVSGILLNPDR